jgi:hypothetical protein
MGHVHGRRSIAYLCVAAALFAALMPGVSIADFAVPAPEWVFLPDVATGHPVPADPPDAVSSAARAPAPGRAPPALVSHN